MPELPGNFEPTEADIDMVIEEVTGKPVKPANLAACIASMQRRIAQLAAEKTKQLDRMDEESDESLKSISPRSTKTSPPPKNDAPITKRKSAARIEDVQALNRLEIGILWP